MNGKLKAYIYNLFLILFLFLNSYAANAFVIKHIKIEGLVSVERGVVYNALPVRVGDNVTAKQSAAIIHKLYRSKLFSDIQVFHEGNTLIIKVKERPTIGVLQIEGNKAIKKEDLTDGLRSIGLYEGAPFDYALLEKVRDELQNAYYSQGKYAATITTTVTKLVRNRVKVDVKIKESVGAKIKRITIIGSKHFSQNELISKLNLSKTGLFSWYTSSDMYTSQKLRADLEILKSFYLDRGYIKFKILSSNVSLSQNKKNIYVTIKIHEGKQYKYGHYQILNNRLISEKALKKLILVHQGNIYSNAEITQTVHNINDKLGAQGYANSEVNVTEKINEENKTVSLQFIINLGKRVYVRRISFIGNNITKTNVLRREMRQLEGGWASTENIRESRLNLMRLGYFESADFQTKPVIGTNNQIDLDVKVKERFSGKFELGLGYSQIDGINYKLGLTQANFAGTGNLVSFLFNKNSASTLYQAAYNNPYYTPSGISRGFDFMYQNTDLNELGIVSYIRDVANAGISYGLPISNNSRLTAKVAYEQNTIKVPGFTDSTPLEIKELLCSDPNAPGSSTCTKKGVFNLGKLDLSWSNVTLDKYVFPTAGITQSLYGTLIIPGSDLEYYTVGYRGSYFYPLYKENYILNLHGRAAYGNAYGKSQIYPIYANFYAGGPSSVRGFQANTLGPKSGSDDNYAPLGGNGLLFASTELIFPTPMIETNTVRSSLFVDSGNVYAINEDAETGAGPLRFSAGISLQWLSPIGQLVFSLAKPINKQPHDRVEFFQFNMGGSF